MTAPIVPPAGRDPASPAQREAARDHLTRLRQQGGTCRSIAAVAVLSPDTVCALACGHRRAQPGTAAAVLTVASPALPHARLDATGTRLRLRALHVMGHGSARIARTAGVHPATIRKLVRGQARTVSAQLRDAIADVYDAWWDNAPPAAPASNAPPPPPRATVPGPGTGAQPPRWMTTGSTSPATSPSTAGNPPPAPAPPRTSTLPHARRKRSRTWPTTST